MYHRSREEKPVFVCVCVFFFFFSDQLSSMYHRTREEKPVILFSRINSPLCITEHAKKSQLFCFLGSTLLYVSQNTRRKASYFVFSDQLSSMYHRTREEKPVILFSRINYPLCITEHAKKSQLFCFLGSTILYVSQNTRRKASYFVFSDQLSSMYHRTREEKPVILGGFFGSTLLYVSQNTRRKASFFFFSDQLSSMYHRTREEKPVILFSRINSPLCITEHAKKSQLFCFLGSTLLYVSQNTRRKASYFFFRINSPLCITEHAKKSQLFCLFFFGSAILYVSQNTRRKASYFGGFFRINYPLCITEHAKILSLIIRAHCSCFTRLATAGGVQISLRAATLRLKLQIKLPISHPITVY